ncbi:hsp70-like protein [Cladophialophora carrionii]|uniref:Hsp70-like protein n=1 Tax=Cladophialophora carrionii TaxID=86049 RepID=A0A1C1CK02_9EURO|nr:hsp70-like protein [Cladophialophora carrionii]
MAMKGTALGIMDAPVKPTHLLLAGKKHAPKPKVPKKSSTPEKRKRPKTEPTPEALERRKKAKASRCCKGKSGRADYRVAFVTSTKTFKDVEVIQKWPGGLAGIAQKVPSRIAYAEENHDIGDEDRWGYDVDAGFLSCSWFKLLLDENTQKTEFDDPLLQQAVGKSLMRIKPGKDAKDVTTDFLRLLHDYIMSQMQKVVGKTAMEQTAFRFQFTLPAVWSLHARESTLAAARAAGFASRESDELFFTEEPEAAFLWTIKSTEDKFVTSPFQENSCVMVVDMGGGTVDLVTYHIIKLQPLQLEEACVGQGAKIGGTAIDRALHELMLKRFDAAFMNLPSEKKGAGSDFLKGFEDIKRNFKGKDKSRKVLRIPLKMNKLDKESDVVRQYYDEDDDMVKLASDDVEAMFEPVLQKSFDLVRRQASRAKQARSPLIRKVVICGGLSCSPYICDRFKVFIDNEFGEGKVELVSPLEPWSAVATGAVLSALEKNPVMFRRARDWIGCCVHTKFKAGFHRTEDQFECPIRGLRAANQMKWTYKRGDKLSENMKKKLELYAIVENAQKEIGEVCLEQVLYKCPLKNAPTRLDENRNKSDQPHVFAIGNLKVDLTAHARAERAKQVEENGESPRVLVFKVIIELFVSSIKGILEASAKIGNKKVGRTTVEYVSDPTWRQTTIIDDEDAQSDDEKAEESDTNDSDIDAGEDEGGEEEDE